ncbi:VP12 [Eriocheir sinensis reovirus]|uniref:VP12 n=1 Tax=Eriocheir sinensis reovirus TaxID=273810 RepID=A0A0E3T4L3_ESRV|nr:VP12 [Eriocheir sinensis reovirus]AKC01931.1 VP12 [Eriocheir sinensis reovirus]
MAANANLNLEINNFAPIISSIGSQLCSLAAHKLLTTRKQYGSGAKSFDEFYAEVGGIIGMMGINSQTPPGIREGIFKLYRSAFLFGDLFPENFGVQNQQYIKSPPEFTAPARKIEIARPAGLRAEVIYNPYEVRFSANAQIPQGTLLGTVTLPIYGSLIATRRCHVNAIGGELTSSRPQISSSVPLPQGEIAVASFDAVEVGYGEGDRLFSVGIAVLASRFSGSVVSMSRHNYMMQIFTELPDGLSERDASAVLHFAQAAPVVLGMMERLTDAPKWVLDY